MSQGKVTAVFLAQARETPMKRVPEALAIAQRGLEGDRHAKKQRVGGKRQVLLMDAQNLRAMGLREGGLIREGDAVTLLDVNPDAPKPIRPKLP